jgi:hypothetical protein
MATSQTPGSFFLCGIVDPSRDAIQRAAQLQAFREKVP